MRHVVRLINGLAVDLILPDGRYICIDYYQRDLESLPELDILLPCDMAANCWSEHLKPAPAIDAVKDHVRLVRQIIIPIEKSK